jgi:hypothetical protein
MIMCALLVEKASAIRERREERDYLSMEEL